MTTLFERIGGETAVEAAVDVFYRKVLADDDINQFFNNVDMNVQRAKQRAFLTMVFGGPDSYTGKDMRAAHARLRDNGLNDNHFDHVVKHLRETLQELGVGESDVTEVIDIAEGARTDVMGR